MPSDQWSIAGHPEPRPLEAGTRLGTYQIESVIGEGGMGTVYRALDTKLNRPVAVKVLSDELADASARRRFSPTSWLTLRRAVGSSVKRRWPPR